jgi:glyoxylase-like metal-dependent hydrolase (beta-lactamase superfamily II)
MNGTNGPEPTVQIQQYDPDTFVIRQSVKITPEAPFVFLFLGPNRALLIDTGDAASVRLRPTIDKLITDWAAAKGIAEPPLMVGHSHAHGDHIAGDPEFRDRPNTTVAGLSPKEVAAFFQLKNWPHEPGVLDLGGREIDIIPWPGHEPAELARFDHQTRLLLTGDALYPGRVYVWLDTFADYRRGVDLVVDYTKNLNVSWVLGNHIEMSTTPGRDYPIGFPSHPDEHVLELPYSVLLEARKTADALGDLPRVEVHPDWILYPMPETYAQRLARSAQQASSPPPAQ